jgi:hypothetical protein
MIIFSLTLEQTSQSITGVYSNICAMKDQIQELDTFLPNHVFTFAQNIILGKSGTSYQFPPAALGSCHASS